MGIPKLLTPADYEEIREIVNGWLGESKQVVLDVNVIEEAMQPEVEPEDLSVEIPEDPQPPDLPEA
jgi:hypothetical protein